jgi:hypothetical protein
MLLELIKGRSGNLVYYVRYMGLLRIAMMHTKLKWK